jgi:glutamine synthetase
MRGRIDLPELSRLVDAEIVTTVLVGFVDMQGRLQGKRCSARHFLDEVATHGAGACDYLLAVDVDMRPQSGYAMSGWERGYGDTVLAPDLTTLRWAGWREDTVLCLSDATWPDGNPVRMSPRTVLQGQVDRLAERGWTAHAATELEDASDRGGRILSRRATGRTGGP